MIFDQGLGNNSLRNGYSCVIHRRSDRDAVCYPETSTYNDWVNGVVVPRQEQYLNVYTADILWKGYSLNYLNPMIDVTNYATLIVDYIVPRGARLRVSMRQPSRMESYRYYTDPERDEMITGWD